MRGFGPGIHYRVDQLSPAREAYILSGTPEEALRQAGITAATEDANIMPLYVRIAGLSIAPGSGDAMSARDSVEAGGRMRDAFRRGDYGGAISSGVEAMAAGLGALPGIGMMARGARTVVPFGRAPVRAPPAVQRTAGTGVEQAVPREQVIRNMGFSDEPFYVAQRHGPLTDIPYDELRRGHVLASSPEDALAFAGLAADDPGAQVMRLRVRTGRVEPAADRRSGEPPLEVMDRIAEAMELAGARGGTRGGSVRLLPGRGTGSPLVVPDHSRIRAAHAAFERERLGVDNLLAGIGGGAVALPLLSVGYGAGYDR